MLLDKSVDNADMPVLYQEWRRNLLAEIDVLPNTVAKGNEFVRRVLQIYYDLSEEDAINATECAGAGDKGVDAIHIVPLEDEGSRIQAIVVQGKYGAAGEGLPVYQESQKFLSAVKDALDGQSVTSAVEQVAGVLKNGGQIRYVVATVDPLDATQSRDLENAKKLAHADFGDSMVVEAINFEDLFTTLGIGTTGTVRTVQLPCRVVPVQGNCFVGAVSLVDMYGMLRAYAIQANGSVNAIYDRNIRKYLKKKTGSVNDGIYKTLQDDPSRFVAYNNGITIVCDNARQIETGMELDNPYVVNGCQTTRTLYDYMDTNFAGVPLHDPGGKMAAYRSSYMAVKVLVATGDDADSYANNITRFSNKQNAVRGKDFIALEDLYRKLKRDLKEEGYFLETQVGEYDALSLAQRQRYPKATHVINAFEATLAYAAGILGKPYLAFGRSADYTPGGREFDETINDLTAADLLVPWMVAGEARDLGYTAIARRNPQPGTEHRTQARYLFLYLFFRLLEKALATSGQTIDGTDSKDQMYRVLRSLKTDHDQTPADARDQHPFHRLLLQTDEAVATYMAIAEAQRWFTDRNSFLKRGELIDETRIIQATTAVNLKIPQISLQIGYIMNTSR